MPSERLRHEPEFTDEAISDLEYIEEYISQNNPTAARRLIERIRDVCFTLADNPYMGVARPDFGPVHRSFVVPRTRYIIIYRPIDDNVEILYVREGSQDIHRLFE